MRNSTPIGIFFLLIFNISIPSFVHAQELTIYHIPSPTSLNWDSPQKILFSYFGNTLRKSPYGKHKYPIGHSVVELRDSSRHSIMGISSTTKTIMIDNVIRQGHGLGILFTVYEGQLITGDRNEIDIRERSKNGDVAFIRFQICQEVFDRLWNYNIEYQEKGNDKLYNGLNKPREGLGAGCSAFAMSFLEVGGLNTILPENEWKVKISIPDKLIGGPIGAEKHVSIFKILLSRKWAKEKKEPFFNLELYDPTRMYTWINKQHKNNTILKDVKFSMIDKARGLTVQSRHISCPDEPIWH